MDFDTRIVSLLNVLGFFSVVSNRSSYNVNVDYTK